MRVLLGSTSGPGTKPAEVTSDASVTSISNWVIVGMKPSGVPEPPMWVTVLQVGHLTGRTQARVARVPGQEDLESLLEDEARLITDARKAVILVDRDGTGLVTAPKNLGPMPWAPRGAGPLQLLKSSNFDRYS